VGTGEGGPLPVPDRQWGKCTFDALDRRTGRAAGVRMKPPAVIYLWARDDDTGRLLGGHERRCRQCAERQDWPVIDVIRETGGDEFSAHRDGLVQVYHHLRSGPAVAVLTTSRSMLGADEVTYRMVAAIIEGEECQGFIQVVS
jgi:hypothetical protein